MIRITMMRSAESSAHYFTAPTDDCGVAVEEHGIWGGKGSVMLGLSGDVSSKEFLALASNRRPDTDGRLTVRTKEYRRAGYDFSFSVPKSLSIYMAETGDKKMERLIKDACRETMEDIEKCMETRVRKNGSDHCRVTGNIVYSEFVHRTTRPVNGRSDPQFHIHCYVFNATFDHEEGRWKAGQFGGVKTSAHIYQGEFLSKVQANLKLRGYRVRKTLKGFELSYISRELIEKFSRRSQIIKEATKAKSEELERRAIALSKGAQIKLEKAIAAIKGKLGKWTRERKPRKKLNPFEQLLSWRKQMTSEERNSVRQAMPISPNTSPKTILNMLVKTKQIEMEQGRER